MIVKFIKIPNGLRWDNIDRFFTYDYLPNGYEIQGIDLANIELNNQIYVMCSNDSSIDGKTFSNIQDEIDYIYS
jgi:hypothetical protein